MPLATQYFEDSLASIKQKDYSFLEQKESQITANKWRAFQLVKAVISSVSGQIHFDWKICQHQLENYFGT